MKIYKKESIVRISDNLYHHELRCQCNAYACVYTLIHESMIRGFEQLRVKCGGKPIYVSSAFRCVYYNSKVGGKRYSKHLLGYALDLLPPADMSIDEFAKLAEDCFDKTIEYKSENFIHVQNEPIN